MKVKELIRQLKEFNPEARVFADSYEGKGIEEILCSFSFTNNGDVILEHADQFDVGCEIGQMLDDYLEDGWDEADAYREMCDRGYTPDIVAEYYNEESAKQIFLYCNSHGIDVGDKARKYMEGKCLCEFCKDNACTIRYGIADDVVCTGTIEAIEECNYV